MIGMMPTLRGYQKDKIKNRHYIPRAKIYEATCGGNPQRCPDNKNLIKKGRSIFPLKAF